MLSRRELLKSAAVLGAGKAFAAPGDRVHLGCQTNAWPIDARDFANVLATIRKIKDYGYEGFETGFANVQGQFDHPADARRQIEAIGIHFFGVHIFQTQYDPAVHIATPDVYERVAIGGAKLGAARLILSGSPPPDDAGRKRKADAMNRAANFAAKQGLKFAYHTHGPETEHNYAELEFLLKETDPSKVQILFDAGHAFEVGSDPVPFIRKHHDRLAGLHLRDFKNGEQVPLGEGPFPLKQVVDAIRETGWSGWALNEEERTTYKPGDSAVKPARDALFRAFGRKV